MPSTPQSPVAIPPPDEAQVWFDFDGTLSQRDVLDDVVDKFAVDDSWKPVLEDWYAGRIGSFEILDKMMDVVRVTDAQLAEFLDSMSVDPGAVSLYRRLDGLNVPMTVLSDGVDVFISHVLGHAGLDHIRVRSNTILRRGDRMKLACPYRDPECESHAAHCKCGSMKKLGVHGRQNIYVGDGRSDLCAARKADIVFAKTALADCLEREGRPFIPFQTLCDVEETLASAWEDSREPTDLRRG
ncbi:MAG: MtnX-like HAD-IB family phosphatase [Candidatus Sumerlaeia bacterium]